MLASANLEKSFAAVAGEYEKFAGFVAGSERLRRLRDDVRQLLGRTPRELIYAEHSTSLWRYRRTTPAVMGRPMLLLPSFVNQPYVMDLLPDQSFVGAMLERGFDVFMLEWGEPTPGQRDRTLEDYLRIYVGRAVRRATRMSGADGVTLAGYCLGGLAALVYAALDGGRAVKRLVTMVTPVNFVDGGILSWWARKEHFDVDRLVAAYGNVPAEYFARSFPWIVPEKQLAKHRVTYELHRDEAFMRKFLALDIWGTDHTAVGGALYRDVIANGYQRNALVEERAWPLRDGAAARLDDVTMPVLNLGAELDHICPCDSVTVLSRLLPGNGDCTSERLPTTHLGIALGTTGANGPTTAYWDRIADWCRERERRS